MRGGVERGRYRTWERATVVLGAAELVVVVVVVINSVKEFIHQTLEWRRYGWQLSRSGAVGHKSHHVGIQFYWRFG